MERTGARRSAELYRRSKQQYLRASGLRDVLAVGSERVPQLPDRLSVCVRVDAKNMVLPFEDVPMFLPVGLLKAIERESAPEHVLQFVPQDSAHSLASTSSAASVSSSTVWSSDSDADECAPSGPSSKRQTFGIPFFIMHLFSQSIGEASLNRKIGTLLRLKEVYDNKQGLLGLANDGIPVVYEGVLRAQVRCVDLELCSGRWWMVSASPRTDSLPPVLNRSTLSSLHMPDFVAKSHNAQLLAAQVSAEAGKLLNPFRATDVSVECPNDPRTNEEVARFSYFLLKNLPLNFDMAIRLFESDVVERLLHIKKELEAKKELLSCILCSKQITRTESVLQMSMEGTCTTRMNPAGVLHQLLTVAEARNIHVETEPSEEFSYFPGFGWSIIKCSRCGNHLGWQFTRVDESIQPNIFFGLLRSSLRALSSSCAPCHS